ncbi:MAG: ABC transporter substrate-binding protein [Rhodoferax sp.]|nr:ABC transporter substrate-binding protein [Rhodoferax sp.]
MSRNTPLALPFPTATRRQALAYIATSSATAAGLAPVQAHASTQAWPRLLAQAQGQTVYFNAWGGAPTINAYIQWAGEQVLQRFGVRVVHVKVSDAADVVKRVRNEKAANNAKGSIDLVWINGENFLTMKREGLLFGPFAEQLPSFSYVDTKGKPTTKIDFSEPVEGMEAPWGMAQLTFMADAKRVPQPPRDLASWLAFAAQHPGRCTYPRPPDFHGTTFIKQMLLDLAPKTDHGPYYQPVRAEVFARMSAPLWKTLDTLHPSLWRQGKQFPNNAAAQRQMMADGELLIALTFNPNEAANEILAKRLPTSSVSFQFSGGTIGNTHFLAIPINSRASAGAQVFANFLLSPQAQARKADVSVWGDPTVLDLRRLPPSDQSYFAAQKLPGQLAESAPALPEPHGSWVHPIEQEWTRRYGV